VVENLVCEEYAVNYQNNKNDLRKVNMEEQSNQISIS
jgi:hypothetical protein